MTMNIDKLMYYLLLLFALATNVSTGVTSAIIVIGILLTMIKFCIKKEKIYIDKGLIIAILVFTVLEVIVGESVQRQRPLHQFRHGPRG